MAYKVEISPALHQHVATLFSQMVPTGQQEAFAAGYARLIRLLSLDPHGVGEVNYHLRGGQPVHHALAGPVSMIFAIYDTHDLVWITRIDRTPTED
jgi:hypothetical protein